MTVEHKSQRTTEYPLEYYCPRCNAFAFIEDEWYQCDCFRCYRHEPRDPYPGFWLDADQLLEAAPAMLAALKAIVDYIDNPEAPTVNASNMTIEERMAGIWAHAVAAIEQATSAG